MDEYEYESEEVDVLDQLIVWLHEQFEFQFDECDHGTYSGGPSHGAKYKMCERIAENMLDDWHVEYVPMFPALAPTLTVVKDDEE